MPPELETILAEAGENHFDIIMKMNVNGDLRGGVYEEELFRLDDADGETLPALALTIATGRQSPVTYTAVPRGLGVRLGIDLDEDGISDYEERRADTDPETVRARVDTDGGVLERRRVLWEVPEGVMTKEVELTLEWVTADLSFVKASAPGVTPIDAYDFFRLGGANARFMREPSTLTFTFSDDDADGIVDGTDVPVASLSLIVVEEAERTVEVLDSHINAEDRTISGSWQPVDFLLDAPRYVLALAEAGAAPSGPAADVNGSGSVDAVDVQLVVNGALGLPVAFDTDIDQSTVTDAVDIQLVINGALGIS